MSSLVLEPVIARATAFKFDTLWLAISEPEVLGRVRIELGQRTVQIPIPCPLHINCANLFDEPTGGVLVWRANLSHHATALPSDTVVMNFNWNDA